MFTNLFERCNDDFKKRVTCQSLAYARANKTQFQGFWKAIRRVKVQGFAHADKIPSNLLSQALLPRLTSSDQIAQAICHVWLCTMVPLHDPIVSLLKEKSIKVVPPSLRGFYYGRKLLEEGDLRSELASILLSQLDNVDIILDDCQFAITLLAADGLWPGIAEPILEHDIPSDEIQTTCISETMFIDSWIDDVTSWSSTDIRWSFLDRTFDRVKAIHANILAAASQKIAIDNLNFQILNNLQKITEIDSDNLFEINRFRGAIQAEAELKKLEALAHVIEQLYTLIKEYVDSDSVRGGSLSERKALRGKLDQLEHAIHQNVQTIRSTLMTGSEGVIPLESEDASKVEIDSKHLPLSDEESLIDQVRLADNILEPEDQSTQQDLADSNIDNLFHTGEDRTIVGTQIPTHQLDDSTKINRNSLDSAANAREVERAPIEDTGSLTDYSLQDKSNNAGHLIAGLLHSNRLSLALALTACNDLTPPVSLADWVLKMAIVGPFLQRDSGPISNEFGMLALAFSDQAFVRGDQDFNQATRFYIWGACLRATILAPSTGVGQILLNLDHEGGLESLYDASKLLAGHSHRGHPIAIDLLRDDSYLNSDVSISRLREEAKECRERLSRQRLNYAPATMFVKRMLEQGGILDYLLTVVEDDRVTDADKIQSELSELETDEARRRKVADLWNRLRAVGSSELNGDAREQVITRFQKVIDIASMWLNIRANRRESYSYVLKEIKHLEASLNVLSSKVMHSLDEYCITRQADRYLACIAANYARDRWIELLSLLRGKYSGDVSTEPDVELLYDGESVLARPLDDNNIRSLLNTIGTCPNYEAVVKTLTEQKNPPLGSISRFLDWLDLMSFDGTDIKSLRSFVSFKDKSLRQEAQSALINLNGKISTALAATALKEKEHLDIDAILKTTEQILSSDAIPNYDDIHKSLSEVNNLINKSYEQALEPLHDYLRTSKDISAPDRERIEDALAKNDIITASELRVRIESGEILAEAKPSGSELNSFRTALSQIGDPKRYVKPHVLNAIKNQQELGPFQFNRIRKAFLDQAQEAMRAWFDSKESKVMTKDNLVELVKFWGFGDHPVVQFFDSQGIKSHFSVARIESRHVCPLPSYGSRADGEYDVECFWDRPSVESIIRRLSVGGKPTLVVYFGMMTEREREQLALRSRINQKNHLLIDDALMLYLCTQKDARLPALFSCALPFGFHEPYITTSGVLPPEMFFGREYELRAIREGRTSLVYGGRQLGKTALLKEAERLAHDPPNSYAIYIDLKANSIGMGREPRDLWLVMLEAFEKNNLLTIERADRRKPYDRFSTYLREITTGQSTKRFLLLLDEADRFLDADKRMGYKVTHQLWQLTQETDRRFTMVLAGLHDVLKASSDWNQPLGQLGKPICIGPLLEGRNAEEARSLISIPLEASGYFLEGDLETRILAQTNYYPSLIQIYCEHLLKLVHERPEGDVHQSQPPYEISTSMVSNAYDAELRDLIGRKFKLTLDLDHRYRLIALIIALESYHDMRVAQHGMSCQRISDDAKVWWPQGYSHGLSNGQLEAILHEMVGLGVLRETSIGFALRSPNITMIIGGETAIERGLDQFLDLPVPPEYDTQTIGRLLESSSGDLKRKMMPLTIHQEQILHEDKSRTVIIYGAPATDIGSLHDIWIQEKHVKGQGIRIDKLIYDNSQSCSEFVKSIDKLIHDNRSKISVVIVGSETPWTEKWAVEALAKVSKAHSGNIVKVIFLADASVAKSLDVVPPMVQRIHLGPWDEGAIENWLSESGCSDHAPVKIIKQHTGGWTRFLYQIDELNPKTPEASKELLKTAFGVEERDRKVLLPLALNSPDPCSFNQLVENQGIGAEGLVRSVVSWCLDLRIISLEKADGVEGSFYSIDPFVARLIVEVGD